MPVFADDRAIKKQLVSELIELLDTKALTQASFELLTTGLMEAQRMDQEIPEESRAEWEVQQKKQEEEMRAFQDRLYSRIDYAKFVDEVYVPMIDKRYSIDELKELIAFFRTKVGQKTVGMLPELGIGGVLKGMKLIEEASRMTQEELTREDEAKHPWKKTMSDMRTLATCLEARATDVNEYPTVAFEELEALVTPTYIRTMPKVDAWGTPYLYVGAAEHYRFVSAGADKRFEWNSRQLDPNLTQATFSDSLDADIIFQDGTFVQSPKEAQGNEQ